MNDVNIYSYLAVKTRLEEFSTWINTNKMKQLIFNNQQKIKKKKRKGKKRKGGKGKGNEKGKRIWVLLKDFWQKIETMYISKKKITTPPFKKQTKKKP